jgi:hypothetical protein
MGVNLVTRVPRNRSCGIDAPGARSSCSWRCQATRVVTLNRSDQSEPETFRKISTKKK